MRRHFLKNISRITRSKQNVRTIFATSRLDISNNEDDPYAKQLAEDAKALNEHREKLKNVNPIIRASTSFKNDMKFAKKKAVNLMGFDPDSEHDANPQFFPTHTDVVVIGGGAIGSSIAYWLQQRAPNAMNVIVLEKDNTYAEASTTLSVGGLRQQFSLPENVQMSLFGADFLRDVGKNLSIDGHPAPDVQFQPYGYLLLASQSGAAQLEENSKLQRKLGACNVLLSPDKLKERFPWMNVDDVEVGCLGLTKEGWFDPWLYLNALKRKSINLGAEYIQGRVIGFTFAKQPLILQPSNDGKVYEQLDRVVFRCPNDEIRSIKFAYCIIAAGAQSGNIARMAGVGEGNGLLSIPLPIEPRKRYVYVYNSPEGPGLNTPLVVDPSGAYFRREGLGGTYIAGMSPTLQEEPSIDNLDVDFEYFDEKIWPLLANRVPAFEKLKVKGGWAGFYEYNTMDENGVVGFHPYYHNLLIASGFSGHGIQHSPAVGRAVMELLLDGEFRTIDLSRFNYDRLCLGEPLKESNIV